MKKLIPTDIPPITSYPMIANMLIFLWPHKEKIMPWFCDHYIQLVIKTDDYESDWANFYDGLHIDNILPAEYCPFCDFRRIDKTTRSKDLQIFTDFIEAQIANGYCIDTCLNQYFLSASHNFHKEHVMHLTFILGYDKGKNKVYIADFYDQGC